jgi:hypothetical protein
MLQAERWRIGVQFPAMAEVILSCTVFRSDLETTQPHIQSIRGALSLRVTRRGAGG